MGRISQRIAAIKESATLAVDARAKALQAAGEDVIGFGAGEPDFPTPAHVVEAAVAACRDPRNHRYTPTAGLPELREAIAHKTKRDSGFDVAAGQVLVTNGGKHAVYTAFQVLLDPGDEVLCPAPYWTTYPEAITLAGGVPVVVATGEASGFRVTIDQLDAALTPARRRCCSCRRATRPARSTRPRRSRRSAAGRVERGIWVITDEIYEHLTFGEHRFSSMPTMVPDLAERCIVLNGVAKTYAMTGWRVGWMIAPPDVTAAAVNFQSHSTSNVSNVAQRAALAAVRAISSRWARCAPRSSGGDGSCTACSPASTACAASSPRARSTASRRSRRCSDARSPAAGPATTLELCEVLLDEAKVALVPGEAFGAPGYCRLSFALGDDDLGEGLRRIATALGS